jgi:outer membrane protein
MDCDQTQTSGIRHLCRDRSNTAQAESQWTVGAGVGVINSPYKQYDRDVYPVPVITYEGDNVWFRGLGGGYYLWNDKADKLSIMAYYDPTHFKPGDSDSTRFASSTSVKAP